MRVAKLAINQGMEVSAEGKAAARRASRLGCFLVSRMQLSLLGFLLGP